MKAKSPKLRFLITLHALVKYADENHRLNAANLQKYLDPFGLPHSRKAFRNTVKILEEYGLNIGKRGNYGHIGIWLNEPLISDDNLKALVCAVSTNPYISAEQAENALKALTPVISVYKEPLLNNHCISLTDELKDKELVHKYSTISQAITENKRVSFRYFVNKNENDSQESKTKYFIPIKILQKENKIFMIGYNCNDKRNEIIDISTISFIKLCVKHKAETIKKDNVIRENFDFSELGIKIG